MPNKNANFCKILVRREWQPLVLEIKKDTKITGSGYMQSTL